MIVMYLRTLIAKFLFFHYYLPPFFFSYEVDTNINVSYNYYILNEYFKQANKLEFFLKFNNLTS